MNNQNYQPLLVFTWNTVLLEPNFKEIFNHSLESPSVENLAIRTQVVSYLKFGHRLTRQPVRLKRQAIYPPPEKPY